MLRVTCAIIQHEGRILVTQRSSRMSHPLKWEFPGGKIEAGEAEEDCIIREIREELHLDIQLLERLTPTVHHYPAVTVELIPFLARQLGGKIRLTEHQDHRYLLPEELLTLDWAAADLPIVNELLSL